MSCLGSFFLQYPGHHRDLHSFPTRRSSDLVAAGVQLGPPGAQYVELVLGERAGREPERTDCGGGEPGLDRKSTRLNSSHVEISYAVFCLKKKKQKQRQRASDL